MVASYLPHDLFCTPKFYSTLFISFLTEKTTFDKAYSDYILVYSIMIAFVLTMLIASLGPHPVSSIRDKYNVVNEY